MSTYKTAEYMPANRRIVSVDGEGKTLDGRHSYTLLAAADDRGYKDYVQYDGTRRESELFDGDRFVNNPHYSRNDTPANYGLPTRECLDFLLTIPQNKSDLIISFAFTYDYTMMLKDLSIFHLWQFAKEGNTIWKGYHISGIPRKHFDVEKDGKRVRVWDVFSYWQMSFVKALNSSLALFTPEQKKLIKTIERMKLARAEFVTMDDDEIRAYCFSECEFLATIYRDLLKNADVLGYVQNSHDGPGSVAAAFFTKEHIKQKMPHGSHATTLAGLLPDVAIFSYYGGRFEISEQGLVGDLIENDIQSAYPAIAVTLPCLACGHFERRTDYDPDREWGFYYVGSRTSGPWAPFPFRADSESGKEYLNGAMKGAIAFVHGGRRWVTASEVKTAREYFGDDAIPVYEGWVFVPGCTDHPFDKIHEMYLWRKIGNPECAECLAGHEGNYFCPNHPTPSDGLSKIIKLMINSIYGKLAQAIGWKWADPNGGEDNPQSYSAPVFQSYIWAAWITGGTRAKVLEAALIAGRNEECPDCKSGDMFRACDTHSIVKSIATDGILSTRDIPELYQHDYELGAWERAPKPDAWLGMPGIYSFIDRGKPDECEVCATLKVACSDHLSDKKYKRRGLDSKYFPATHLRGAWERGLWSIGPIGDQDCSQCERKREACDEHGIRAFMPVRQAVTRINALDLMGEWVQLTKRVKFRSVSHKRNYPDDDDDDWLMPHDRSIPLTAITIPDNIRSQPYSPKQTWEDVTIGRPNDPDIPMWDNMDDMPEHAEIGEVS
jgi:hypothetical protein